MYGNMVWVCVLYILCVSASGSKKYTRSSRRSFVQLNWMCAVNTSLGRGKKILFLAYITIHFFCPEKKGERKKNYYFVCNNSIWWFFFRLLQFLSFSQLFLLVFFLLFFFVQSGHNENFLLNMCELFLCVCTRTPTKFYLIVLFACCVEKKNRISYKNCLVICCGQMAMITLLFMSMHTTISVFLFSFQRIFIGAFPLLHWFNISAL